DDFRSPIIRGMRRTKPQERARTRILSDDELRSVWAAAGSARGAFPKMVRFLLLTAARRCEASNMTWDEIRGNDWTLPASRNKTKQDFIRPLSRAAQDVLAGLPRFVNSPYVFTTDGSCPITGFTVFKERFDEACGVTGWTIHDLRRTARTLLS